MLLPMLTSGRWKWALVGSPYMSVFLGGGCCTHELGRQRKAGRQAGRWGRPAVTQHAAGTVTSQNGWRGRQAGRQRPPGVNAHRG
jgi:hypothetical protein